jgi:hypothetical protein
MRTFASLIAAADEEVPPAFPEEVLLAPAAEGAS